jgi:O-succinylbenzoic acid--CoA ligase
MGWEPMSASDAARWLLALGLRPGQRVALAGLNDAGTAQVLRAGLELGLDWMLLNRRLTRAELAEQLARVPCAAVVAAPAHPAAALGPYHALPDAFAEAPTWTCRGGLVLCTSGTEGRPKACHLPAAALMASIDAAVQVLALTPDDVWGCPLPLDHIGGAMCVLRAAASGGRMRLGDDLAGCTGVSVVPTQLQRLCTRHSRWPEGLRRMLVGGGPLDAATAAACAARGLVARQTYGLTEMASMVTVQDADDPDPASAGRPVPGAEVALIDGRIAVRGRMRAVGYLGEPPFGDWLVTGDLGRIVDGRLFVLGRVAELIVSGGENVYPAEVEAALAAHPAVAEAGVCGLPDPTWGQTVAAVVVLRGTVDDMELDRFLDARLARFKHPRRYLRVATLPRTSLGKLRRAALAGLF